MYIYMSSARKKQGTQCPGKRHSCFHLNSSFTTFYYSYYTVREDTT